MLDFFLLLVSKKSAFQKLIAALGFEFQSIFGLKRSFSVKAAVCLQSAGNVSLLVIQIGIISLHKQDYFIYK